MFYRTIILSLVVLLVAFSMELRAQTSGQIGTAISQESRAGNIIGGGVGFHWFHTSWKVPYYYGQYSYYEPYYPYHDMSRVAIFAFYERRSVFTFGPVHVNGRAEIHVGISGGTEEDWAPGGETISEGGGTFVADGIVKFAYPTQLTPTLPIAPYAGLGFQYAIIGSNGEGVSNNLTDSRGYYEDGWTEYPKGLIMGFGVDVDFPKFVATAEYRFMLIGGASADWDPSGSDPEENEDQGSSFGAFLIGFGYKF